MGTSATVNFPGSDVGIVTDSELKENSFRCLKIGQSLIPFAMYDDDTAYLLQKFHLISLSRVMVQKIGRHQAGQACAHNSDSPPLLSLLAHGMSRPARCILYNIQWGG